jgi:hypothetical protein
MGYYIEVPKNKNKAEQIVELFGGEIVSMPNAFSDIPEDKALIVVVDNGPFEAAGLAFNESEFKEFTAPDSGRQRPRKFVLMDKEKAYLESGYQRKQAE